MGRRAAACLFLIGCAAPATEPPDEKTATQADTACADGGVLHGMDVSYYDPTIDWPTVKAAGIDFAIVRVTDGTQYLDPRFQEYWAAAKAAGVVRGAYQFFRPAQDPIAQADLLLETMGPLEPGDLPPTIDVETSGGLSTTEVAAAVRAWVDHVEAAVGRPPIVYAGLYSWHDLTGNADMTAYPLWVAQYTSAPCPNIPVPWTRWAFWQTGAGHVDGIPGDQLDVDVFNGTKADLMALTVDPPACGTIAPTGGEIDDGDACFREGGPTAYMRHVTDAGEGGDLVWTHATASAAEANYAQWDLVFAEAGTYRVEVYTAGAYAQSKRAVYHVTAADGAHDVPLDQSTADGWQSLGAFPFGAGGAQSVHLSDNTGEASADNIQLVFDAVRLTRIDLPGQGSGSDLPPAANDGGGCSTTHGGAGLAFALGAVGLAARRRRAHR